MMFSWVNTDEVQVLSAVNGLKGLTYIDPSELSISGGSITSLANISGHPSETCIFEIPAGTTVEGNYLKYGFIQIGINSNSYANVTTDGISIIRNACLYLLVDNLSDVNQYLSEREGLVCYPTVFNDCVNIIYTAKQNEVLKLRLTNLQGRIVYTNNYKTEAGTNQIELLLPGLSNGVYILNTISQSGIYSKKLIKNSTTTEFIP